MMQRYGDGGAKPLPNFLAKCANPIVFQNTFINFAIVMSNNIKKNKCKERFFAFVAEQRQCDNA
jgi:hypothetical protein